MIEDLPSAAKWTATIVTSALGFYLTYKVTRRLLTSSCRLFCCASAKVEVTTAVKSAPVKETANLTAPAVNLAAPVATCSAEESSYLCTKCGTEAKDCGSLASPTEAQKRSEPKMVILVRTDLNMGKGKAAAQCCHAVLAAFKTASHHQPSALSRWERSGQPKVTLKVDSEEAMVELMKKARAVGIVAESIRDAGRTQVVSGTRTVCAIGPAPAALVDQITGHLKLY